MKILNKDITTVTQGYILHGVNCMNVMGSGVAKVLYTKWPKVKLEFHRLSYGTLGNISLVEVEEGLTVVNCYTQELFGKDGRLYASPEAIEICLKSLHGLPGPFYLPAIGCGLGGMSLDILKDIILKVEKKYDMEFNLCLL